MLKSQGAAHKFPTPDRTKYVNNQFCDHVLVSVLVSVWKGYGIMRLALGFTSSLLKSPGRAVAHMGLAHEPCCVVHSA